MSISLVVKTSLVAAAAAAICGGTVKGMRALSRLEAEFTRKIGCEMSPSCRDRDMQNMPRLPHGSITKDNFPLKL